MTTLLELNDADLTLYRDGRPVYRAPGIAVVTDRGILFGESALRLSRIYPRQTNLQYFGRMSGDPLPHPGPGARNHADLVYLHLRELAPLVEEEIILAVPAVFSAEQLGVLLGILQELGIAVAGFVDSAVAAAAALPLPARVWHLDVLLHRSVLTALVADDQVARRGVEEISDCGLVRLLDHWTNAIADRFIRETRFDPLHAAATEQQLFDQLFDLVWSGITDRELAFEIAQGEQTRRVELGRQVLDERALPRFRQIAERLPSGGHVLVTARSAPLPGLLDAFREAGLTLTILRADALPNGCAESATSIVTGGGDLRLITRLPRLAPPFPTATAPTVAAPGGAGGAPAGSAAAEAPSAPPLPTHVLAGHRALPLGHGALGFDVVRHGTVTLVRPAHGLLLNGAAIFRDTALEIGDRIGLDGREFLVISVEG